MEAHASKSTCTTLHLRGLDTRFLNSNAHSACPYRDNVQRNCGLKRKVRAQWQYLHSSECVGKAVLDLKESKMWIFTQRL